MNRHIRSTLAAWVVLTGVSNLLASDIFKANNASNLNLSAAWVGGVVPGSNDVAQWDGTLTAANTVLLGADTSWSGAKILSPGGLVQINAGNKLTLGASGVDMSTANNNFTLNCALTIGADQSWNAGGKQFSAWGPAVNMGGHQVTILAGNKIQFKSTIAGNGTLIANGGVTQLSSGTTASNTTVVVGSGATLLFDTATGAAAGIRAQNARLNGGTLSINANTSMNTIDYVANALTLDSRFSTLTITSAINRNTQLRAGSYVRNPGALALFAGLNLGLNPIASAVTNSTSIWFDTPPALLGSGGGAGTTTNSILVGVLSDTTAGGSGMGLTTYDTNYGVRLLNPLTECTAIISDGQTQLDNVRLTNAVNTVLTNTLNSATTVNSLSFRIDAGAQTQCGIRITGAGPLKLNSGSIAGAVNTTAISTTNSFFLDVASLDLNGQEGLIAALGTGTQGGGSHSGAMLDLACSITNDGGKGVTVSGSVVKFSGSTTNRYTGDTRCNSGFLWLAKSNSPLPGNLVVNGGSVQNTGNQIADSCDLFINGGSYSQKGGDWNSGTGAWETFRNLYMTGGSYGDGAGGTSSGNTCLTNAFLAGGTWTVSSGHTTQIGGSLVLAGGVLTVYRANDTSRNTTLTTMGIMTITNTLSGAYSPLSINGGAGAGVNGGRFVLSNDLVFVGNAANTNSVIINTTAPSSGGGSAQLRLAGTRVFDIGDGAASADLTLMPVLVDNGVTVGALTKAGAGTLVLAATNAYTGATTVSNGTLVLAGSLASAVTVCSSAVLTGTGWIGATGTALTVNAGGIVDPGAVGSVGTLTVTGNVSFAGSAVYRVDVNGGSPDLLAVSGGVSASGGPVTVSVVGGGAAPWLILSATSGITGTFTTTAPGLVVEKRNSSTELWLGRNQGTLIKVL